MPGDRTQTIRLVSGGNLYGSFMSPKTSTIGTIIYTINALAAVDPAFSTADIDDSSMRGMLDQIAESAKRNGVDTSRLEAVLTLDADSKTEIDEVFARWINNADAETYLLPWERTRGWTWLSSIAVDAFLISN